MSRLAAEPTAEGSDQELLRRFADTHDETAFVLLLDRHGPLVWAVCRQMLPTPADAEDAFQASLLALVQSAAQVGRVKSVGGWLHGVAVKVCLKVRRTAARRKARDERSAKPEAAPPEPQWDDLHAAVHEEIERLPAVLRAVFVLCEMEGVRQPDAAARLGCKLGTVSGRLTRARQALLKALTARGLAPSVTVGVLAAGGSAGALPAALIEKALAAARVGHGAGLAVPSGVLQLAKSVTGGVSMKAKILAATIAVATGLMTAGGWFAVADAQVPPPNPAPQAPEFPGPQAPPVPPRPVDPFAGTGEDEPPPARIPQPPRPPEPPRPVDPARLAEPREPQPPRDPVAPRDPLIGEPRRAPEPPPAARAPQQRFEHLLADAPNTKDELEKLIRKHEATGWEFAGQAGAGKETQVVFKRPKAMTPSEWGAPRGPRDPNLPVPDGRALPPTIPLPPAAPLPPRRGGGADIAPPAAPLPPRRELPQPVPDGGDELPSPRRDTIPQRDTPQRREAGADRLPPADEPADDNVTAQAPPGYRAVTRIMYVKKQGPGGAMYYEPVRQIAFVPVPADVPSQPVPFEAAERPVPSASYPSPSLPALGTIPSAAAEETELHVLELKHATPMTISVHVKKFFANAEVSIDDDTGSLVIRCSKKTLDEIKKLMEKLDKPAKNSSRA